MLFYKILMASQYQVSLLENRTEPFQHRCCTDEMVLEQIPQAIHLAKQTSIIEIQAQRFPEQRFIREGKPVSVTWHSI